MEFTDKDFSLEIFELKNQSNQSDEISFKVRILPKPILFEKMNQELKDAFWYHMDSCFYLKSGKSDIRAALVQPIADGVKGSFEYLVTFQIKDDNNQNREFVYRDKFLNKKQYFLKLKR